MIKNGVRFALLVVILCGLSTFVFAQEAAQEGLPTISELEALLEEAAPPEEGLSAGVEEAILEAEQKLEEGLPDVAKEILMRLERTVELSAADMKALDEAHKKVDEALGKARKKVEKEIEKKLALEAPPTAEEDAAERILREARRKMLIEQALRRAKARQFVGYAQTLLYSELKPEEAREWALKALVLDPENKDAQDVKADAEIEMGLPGAKEIKTIKDAVGLQSIREKFMQQQLRNAKAQAAALYAEGDYEQALAKWRLARTYIVSLSVYRDGMEAERAEVEEQIQLTKEALEKARKRLAEEREKEAAEEIKQGITDVMEMETKKRADLIEDVAKLIREKRFQEAEKALKMWEYEEPGAVLPPVMREDAVREDHIHQMAKLRRENEREGLRVIENSYEKTIPYSKVIDYPDIRTWKEVISVRDEVPYPSRVRYITPEEKEVYAKLAKKVRLEFDATPLEQVVEFLGEYTDVNFTLIRQDVPPDGAPITLRCETSIEDALDEIARLSGMGWKVKGPFVTIGNPERLKDYELRVYDVRDLLYNVSDRGAGEGRAGEGRGGGGTEVSYGGEEWGQWGGEEAWSGAEAGAERGEGEVEDLQDRADSLRLLIMATVAPGTWAAGGVIGGPEREGREGREIEGAWGVGGVGVGATPQVGAGGAEMWGMGAEFAAAPEEAVTAPRGRIFVRGGNPGDLLILQTPEVHEEIERLLRTLRRTQHLQVRVEARFLTVSADFLEEVGFHWDAFSLQSTAFTGPGGTQEDDFILMSPTYGGMTPTVLGSNYVISPTGPTPGMPFIGTGVPYFTPSVGMNLNFSIFDGERSLIGFFRAAQQHSGANVLSAPAVTLMNAQRGYLTITTTYHYVSTFSVEEGVPVPETEEVEDVVELEVRPVVSADRRYVFLELIPYTSKVLEFERYDFLTAVTAPGDGDGGGAVALLPNYTQLPRTVEQELETTVCVPDKGILMIGGLADSRRTEQETGVPILSKVPLLKRLFVSTGTQMKRSHLLILVQPEIIELVERERLEF